jgi:hypothetical protein
MYRVFGAVPILTANTNVHLLNNGTAEYFIINGSMTENENGFTQEELKYLRKFSRSKICLSKTHLESTQNRKTSTLPCFGIHHSTKYVEYSKLDN